MTSSNKSSPISPSKLSTTAWNSVKSITPLTPPSKLTFVILEIYLLIQLSSIYCYWSDKENKIKSIFIDYYLN